MRKVTVAFVGLALVLGMAAGFLLGGRQDIACAQEKPVDKPVDIAAIVNPSAVVAAVPYQSRTDYEQDPFEPTRLRRTNTVVTRVLLVRQDGTVIIKESP